MPFATIYTEITTRLQYVAASIDALELLRADAAAPNDRPPLYIWDAESIDEADSDGQNYGSRNPKAYGNDAHVWTIHMWGATRTDCERMRGALVRSTREAVNGRSYKLGKATWGFPDWSRTGFVLSLEMTVHMPLVAVEVPTAAGTGIPSTDVTNDTEATVTITAVTPLDTTGAVAGDGTLQGGEG